ncbi:hypothetical protein MTR67_013746 [Solanum verrucosum]|uniref:Protein kinase domain-containing protein n=1 Tax=Solanum verrucosum TaxID=315347 RepID=A0AAF0TI73_SOLVR|nr:hypothetical protein MTR67_013746 [Solanum verrucosum]
MPSRELRSLPPSPLLSPPHVHRQSHNLLPPLAGGIAAAASLLILFTFCFRKISLKRTVPSSDSESKPPHRFSYTSLRRATSKFSPSLRLGQGGFGSVYRGTVKSPTTNSNVSVAVKGEREFQNELFFAGKIDSKYIVSTIGFSSDKRGRRMLLVYELLANGSLQDCLLHRKCSELKDWKKRLSIALDIAKGLEYLHHFCDPPAIHGDIKPSNILLDDNFNAKIGDFGLARLKGGGISSTPSMRGTVCYVAPEYGSCGDLSEKCDVYSYGVLLLVLIAGRRPLQVTGSPMSEFQRANLLSWARHLARAGKLLDLVDQTVESLDKEQALLSITVALLCLQKSPARRPSMKEVVGMLSGDLEAPQLPVELSPSPPSRFPIKSHKKVR